LIKIISQVLKIRNDHQEIDFLTLSDISKFRLCNFNLVEKGRPFRNIWNTLYNGQLRDPGFAFKSHRQTFNTNKKRKGCCIVWITIQENLKNLHGYIKLKKLKSHHLVGSIYRLKTSFSRLQKI